MYNSATVLPIHPETIKKQDFLSSKKLWRTENGFTFPGKKTSLVSNIHPRKPDSARVDELRKVWKNIVTNLACFSDNCSEAVVFFFFFALVLSKFHGLINLWGVFMLTSPLIP